MTDRSTSDAALRPEWRQCVITGRWVAIAPSRSLRPHDFAANDLAPASRDGASTSESSTDESLSKKSASETPTSDREPSTCPFCMGHEGETTDEICAVRDPQTLPNSPGWHVRVVANKFPAVDAALPLETWQRSFSRGLTGFGVHDVIIESPRHVTSTGELDDEQFAKVLGIYRRRLLELRQDRRLRYGLIFKNVGAAAGASLAHLHSQLIGMPMLPATVLDEFAGAERYWLEHGRCIFCDLIEAERLNAERIVSVSQDWIAFCPAASRFSWETWVAPRQHSATFEALPESQLHGLAAFLRDVLARIERTLPRRAYNYYIHTSPFDTSEPAHYHWHLEILPRVHSAAGFEWGTGFAINAVAPEQAAASLRQASSLSCG